MTPPIPLAYTFGNHMHWVDMQWLWGYDVLPGSVDDMLRYCREAGVKGCLNFDGIGYEKMAAEHPEHLAKLREAIQEGIIEVVGASYGQPYGLFHGGESNIRQRIYGVRAAIRLLGTRPRTFWEEEFDFFPQLPQILAGCGYTGASLYFQWTWHTPEVPMEDAPVVLWEGLDGTQLPTTTRNRMNLHQWPEDFRLLLDDLAANPPEEGEVPPLVQQWLELMPTPDWMCRSELMLPMLSELKADPRFELVAVTLGEYLKQWEGKELPVRRYTLDDVWHGMTLGKNGDNHPKTSAALEHQILAAETASAILGLFGRPYEPWDVYPTWELEECWRNLLAAQHHDNHECEGLCGHVAQAQFDYAFSLLRNSDAVYRLARRVGKNVRFNSSGWDVRGVRPLGYRSADHSDAKWPPCERSWVVRDGVAYWNEGDCEAQIDTTSGRVILFRSQYGVIESLDMHVDLIDQDWKPTAKSGVRGWLYLEKQDSGQRAWYRVHAVKGELEIRLDLTASFEDAGPGYGGALRSHWNVEGELLADGPAFAYEVGEGSTGRRKYPEGDWMTSPQWFEAVEGAFTSLSFIRTQTMLISHSGAQQWFRTPAGIANIIDAVDPWDGQKYVPRKELSYRIRPHNGLTPAECYRIASSARGSEGPPDSTERYEEHPLCNPEDTPPCNSLLPGDFSAVRVHAENVIATAFYREQSSYCGRGLENYAGEGIAHPYILRLVEYNGEAGDVEITLPGPIAAAYKTNLMGEILSALAVTPDDPRLLTSEPEKLQPFGIEAVRVRVPMRAHEIATLYLDIVPGRKQFRDLDAKREVWATVHRTAEEPS